MAYQELGAPSRTMGRRFHQSLEIATNLDGYSQLHAMSTSDWLKIDKEEYNTLDSLLGALHAGTQKTYHDYDAAIDLPEMVADWKGLKTHVQVMKNLAEIYWQDESFKQLFPPGTTLEFVYACMDLHDLGRFCGMNANAQLVAADVVSHELLKKMFPGFPQDTYLHDIGYITGDKPLPNPEENVFIYCMKLFDTCGKNPPRHPEDLYASDGLYEQWYRQQLANGSLPITKIQPISAVGYKDNDIRFTKQAAELVRHTFPNVDFDEALDRAASIR